MNHIVRPWPVVGYDQESTTYSKAYLQWSRTNLYTCVLIHLQWGQMLYRIISFNVLPAEFAHVCIELVSKSWCSLLSPRPCCVTLVVWALQIEYLIWKFPSKISNLFKEIWTFQLGYFKSNTKCSIKLHLRTLKHRTIFHEGGCDWYFLDPSPRTAD